MSKEERFCGNCAWFKHEDTDGGGICYREEQFLEQFVECDEPCHTGAFVSREKERHYRAVLLQHNRWRRDKHVPCIYRMPAPKEFGKALDFACETMRVFSKL